MSEVLTSARAGTEIIRRSLLEILQQRQIAPLEAVGQPFDPSRMYALGRVEHADVEENTVVTEVVRGYVWKNRVLRESQVMVAVKPSATEDPSN
jgi:molecular chaperone GrpE